MADLTFADVLDDSILVYVEDHQAYLTWLTEQTGGGVGQVKTDWGRQQLVYEPRLHKRDEVVARFHYIALVSDDDPADGRPTVAWGWGDEAMAERPECRLVPRLKTFGEGHHIAELTEPRLELDGEGAEVLSSWATRVAAVACRVLGFQVAHIASPAEEARVVLLVDPAGFEPARPSAVTFPGILTGALQAEGWIHDPRRAVQGYAQARQLPYGWEPGFGAINIGFPEGNLRVAFDEQGRVGSIDAQMAQGAQPGEA